MTIHEREKAIYLFLLRYLPVFCAFLIIVHYTHLLFGYSTILADYVADLSFFGFIFMLMSSKVFGFCRLHRAFITYIAVASFDIDVHQRTSFHVYPLESIPSVFVLGGVVLFVLLYFQIKRKKHF